MSTLSCLPPADLKFPRASVLFCWLFFFFFQEVNVGSGSRETDNVRACSLKDKSTFTHKVQVSASRTATGAVLPIGLTDQNVLLQFRDSTFGFFQVPSDRPFPVAQREDGSLPLFSPRPADRRRLGGVMSLLCLSETQTLFPPEWKSQPASADVLLTGLRVQEDEAHFASQEVDVDLEQLCRRGYPPCSLNLRCAGWWCEFLRGGKRPK